MEFELLPPEEGKPVRKEDLAEMPTDSEFQTLHGRILNVSNGWQPMIEAASLAFARMNQGGSKFRINIDDLESGIDLHQVAANAWRDMMSVAQECAEERIPVERLNDDQKLCICVACKVPIETEGGNGLTLRIKTAMPCAIVATEIGYHVYVKA